MRYALASECEGGWNYRTFQRDGGEMRIYLNGNLWQSGSGFTRTYTPVTTATLAADYSGGNNYDGYIDEFAET